MAGTSITRYFGVSITEEEAKNGKEPQVVYYSSDENKQAQYIAMFREAGLDAIICDEYIDPHFISDRSTCRRPSL